MLGLKIIYISKVGPTSWNDTEKGDPDKSSSMDINVHVNRQDYIFPLMQLDIDKLHPAHQ